MSRRPAATSSSFQVSVSDPARPCGSDPISSRAAGHAKCSAPSHPGRTVPSTCPTPRASSKRSRACSSAPESALTKRSQNFYQPGICARGADLPPGQGWGHGRLGRLPVAGAAAHWTGASFPWCLGRWAGPNPPAFLSLVSGRRSPCWLNGEALMLPAYFCQAVPNLS